MFRLLTNLVFGIYKTKWTYHLPRRKPGRQLQKPFKNWTIVKGDIVQLRSGDDKGKVGKVVKVLRKLNRVVVKGANVQQYTKKIDERSVRTKKASSVHVSNVGLYDGSVKKAVRVKIAFHPQTGERLRISKKSGRILYKTKSQRHKRSKRGAKRKLGLKDTPTVLAHKITYQGQDFDAIKREFQQFIAEKETRQKHLVFKE